MHLPIIFGTVVLANYRLASKGNAIHKETEEMEQLLHQGVNC
jgi:hypothetical protein